MYTDFARALITDDKGGFPLLDHAIDRWSFPGGKIEEGEAVTDGLIREVLEETGVTVSDLTLLWRGHLTFPDGEWTGHFYFAGRAKGIPTMTEPQKFNGIWFADPTDLPVAETLKILMPALVKRVRAAGFKTTWD